MNLLQTETLGSYQRSRARSRELFDVLTDEAYYSQPIALRHPIVFYEGHLPGFSFNSLMKKALGRPSIDARLEDLFARGIDPHESSAATGAAASAESLWPSRDVVRAFAADADRKIEDVLATGELDRPGHPLLDQAEAAFCIIEHEALHHETLLYMWHRLPFALKQRPPGYYPLTEGASPSAEWITVPAGRATLGVDRDSTQFGWDNEFPARAEDVAAFAIERHDVTNSRFLEFVEAGGYRDPCWWTEDDWQWLQQEGASHPLFWERCGDAWQWRGMFELFPLPLSWPVYVSHAEASAFARWRGSRLPTEAEFQRTVCSISRVGIPNPSAATKRARAPGVWKILWATAGSGQAQCSARFQDFGRWRRIRNTRRTFSTTSTWS